VRTRTRTVVVTAALTAAGLAACGDDGAGAAASAAPAITTRAEWCTVVGEVDDAFLAADTSDAPFAERQAQYAAIADDLGRLVEAVDLVDEPNRADVAASLAFGANVANAVVGADDADAAAAAVSELIGERGERVELPGAGWILDACGVDIDG
jgi:hypothetical protein